MKSISSSSRSMSVSRSFSNYIKRSNSERGKKLTNEARDYSISSSESKSASRPRRRQSDSRGSSSRSYSPRRRRQHRDSSDSVSTSRSHSRRRHSSSSMSSSSRLGGSSRSHSKNRRSRSASRGNRRNRHNRRSVSSDRHKSSRYSRRPYSDRRYAPRDERNRDTNRRHDKRSVIKSNYKDNSGRRDGYSWTKSGRRVPVAIASRATAKTRALAARPNDRRANYMKKGGIDRTVHTPFLLRIYAFLDDTLAEQQGVEEDYEEFQKNIELSESVRKLELYIWPDSTLRDLVGLVKDLCETAHQKDGVWRFHLNNKTRDVLGKIHSYKWRRSSDSTTLRNTSFRIGDSLLLFFHDGTAAPVADIDMGV